MATNNNPRLTVPSIRARKNSDKKIVALTAYDYTIARLLDRAGIDFILVGDSLGNVVQGMDTTLPVTLDEIIYHSRCVARGISRALLVGDLPFLSYQPSVSKAIESAGRLIKEGGVSAVKLEGGVHMQETIAAIVNVDIPVMGHIGLTPQSYHRMGGYRLQGKTSQQEQEALDGIHSQVGSYDRVIEDAIAVEKAGAFAIVIEGVPTELAQEITERLSIPTIGIGAGRECDGQILVTNDILGLDEDFCPRFVKRYAELATVITDSVDQYIDEVRGGNFPGDDHSVFDGGKRTSKKRKVSSLRLA